MYTSICFDLGITAMTNNLPVENTSNY